MATTERSRKVVQMIFYNATHSVMIQSVKDLLSSYICAESDIFLFRLPLISGTLLDKRYSLLDDSV